MTQNIVTEFFDMKMSRGLSIGEFLKTSFYAGAFFGILIGIITSSGAILPKFAILGCLIYAVVMIFCDVVFVIDWDIFIPEFKSFVDKLSKSPALR